MLGSQQGFFGKQPFFIVKRLDEVKDISPSVDMANSVLSVENEIMDGTFSLVDNIWTHFGPILTLFTS